MTAGLVVWKNVLVGEAMWMMWLWLSPPLGGAWSSNGLHADQRPRGRRLKVIAQTLHVWIGLDA